jgi:hypothetical protein
MPSHDPAVRALACTIAATERHHPNADTSELRRDLRAASLAEHIRKVVDSAPPLSDQQRARLAALLHPSGGGANAA